MKCETPFWSAVSRRDPLEIQMPTETDRTCGIASVMTLIPFESVVVKMSRSPVDVSGAGVGETAVWLDDNVVNLPDLYHIAALALPRRACVLE
jgi:hypothetical protein